MLILDHVAVNVTDYARSRRFYERALEPLGIRVVMEFGSYCGFGRDKPDFWIGAGAASYQRSAQLAPITPVHIAFAARSLAEVDAFWTARRAA